MGESLLFLTGNKEITASHRVNGSLDASLGAGDG